MVRLIRQTLERRRMPRKSLLAFVASLLLASGCATVNSGVDQRDRIVLVKVKKNDTLNMIAKRHDTTWQSIAVLNREQLTNGLREGQELRVKSGSIYLGSVDSVGAGSQADMEHGDESDDFLPKRKRGLFFSPSSGEPPALMMPAPGRVSSRFGKRGRRLHKGIDIVANVGTPIVASADGEVIFAGRQRGYGSTVVIDHGEFMTLYAHASKIIARTGDVVKQGDFIAKVGKTGNARGAHLHFELRDRDNKPLNPIQYFRVINVAQSDTSLRASEEASDRLNGKSSKNKRRQARQGRGKKRLLYAKD
jgi:murein DD-endopeptidase MepM/ murein hydrolase activator NlpD